MVNVLEAAEFIGDIVEDGAEVDEAVEVEAEEEQLEFTDEEIKAAHAEMDRLQIEGFPDDPRESWFYTEAEKKELDAKRPIAIQSGMAMCVIVTVPGSDLGFSQLMGGIEVDQRDRNLLTAISETSEGGLSTSKIAVGAATTVSVALQVAEQLNQGIIPEDVSVGSLEQLRALIHSLDQAKWLGSKLKGAGGPFEATLRRKLGEAHASLQGRGRLGAHETLDLARSFESINQASERLKEVNTQVTAFSQN